MKLFLLLDRDGNDGMGKLSSTGKDIRLFLSTENHCAQ